MSNQSNDTLLDHLDGIGIGLCLLIAGLVMSIGDLGPGIAVGLPMTVMGCLVPLGMTYNARTEAERQEARRRPERTAGETYSISSKKRKG